MPGPGLPPPPPNFLQRKCKILEQLAIPDSEYTDASPKGSVDAGIRDLINEINALDGFVTTSSCAGRVSVFVEGMKSVKQGVEIAEDARLATVAGVGGKGGGGSWTFVSHEPVDSVRKAGALEEVLGLKSRESPGHAPDQGKTGARLIHFKFEPMILHVLTASLEHAQVLLRCGLQAGFRESGAINLTATGGEAAIPIVAIRSMGLALESLVGIQNGDEIQNTVSIEYLQTLVTISNERFIENTKRIQRFRAAVLDAAQPPTKKDGSEWEDTAVRRERKKAEGLRRKAELEATQQQKQVPEPDQSQDLSLNGDLT
ncbi:tRNA wybutosine-synthesizing protein [Xylariales sp. AK1849]|nr:tRNA wybutosine-synthesizing protein [Xylariales sp. AK1849]